MVKSWRCFRLVWLLIVLPVSLLWAKDPAAYRLGDTAEEDLSTPVALDVINPEATAARRTAEALKTPAIFRNCPDPATNAIATALQTAFASTRSNFLAGLGGKKPGSPEFDEFVITFNARNKSLPVSADLAELWARGDAGAEIQNQWLGSLLKMMHRPVGPDTLPAGFEVGDTLRLVPVHAPDEVITLETAEQEGKLITGASLTLLSRLRMLLRHDFPDNQQALARALGAFLAPNCVPDPALTRQARDRDASQLVVVNHYDPGTLVLRRGQIIDTKAKAALDQLHDKTVSGLLAQQIAAEHNLAQQAQLQAQQARAQAQAEHEQMLKFQEQALQLQTQTAKARTRDWGWILGLAAVMAVVLFRFRRPARQPRPQTLLPMRPADLPVPVPSAIQSEFAPHLARIIKEALVQELAAQRSELMQAQRTAALEIAGLVQRLDELQTPLHDRLRAYETRIQELEKELAARNEENRELLKLKIEMIRRQIEAERSASGRLGFN